jgi:predicted nucleic acid-binding protein
MAYLDTNIIVSYCFKDENYAKTAKTIEGLRRERKQLYISPLTLTELFAVVSTKGSEFKVPPHFKRFDRRTRVNLLVKYALETLKLTVAPDEPLTEKFDEASVFHIYKKVIELSPHLRAPNPRPPPRGLRAPPRGQRPRGHARILRRQSARQKEALRKPRDKGLRAGLATNPAPRRKTRSQRAKRRRAGPPARLRPAAAPLEEAPSAGPAGPLFPSLGERERLAQAVKLARCSRGSGCR